MGRVVRCKTGGFTPVLSDDFYNSDSEDCRLVVLTSRDVTVIRSVLVGAYWPTRFGRYVSPGLFEVESNGDLLALLRELEVKLMGCNIIDAFNNIADAIKFMASTKCDPCSSIIKETNGGVNGVTPSGDITYGTVPYKDYPQQLPDGYTSQEQFDTQRCGMANLIVDGMVYTLKSMSGVSGIQAIGATLLLVVSVVGIIVLPEVVIPMLITGLALLWAASGTLLGLSVAVEQARSDIVCVLINGDNLDVTISLLADIFDNIIESIPLSGPLAVAAKTVLMVLANSDTLNQLYGDYAGFAYPQADCSGCNADIVYVVAVDGITTGVITGGNLHGGQVTLDAVNVPFLGNQQALQYRVSLGTVNGLVASYNWSISNPGGSDLCLEWTDGNGAHYASDPSQVSQPLEAIVIQVRSEDSANNHLFSVDFTYEQ